jgi:hypothetical protein
MPGNDNGTVAAAEFPAAIAGTLRLFQVEQSLATLSAPAIPTNFAFPMRGRTLSLEPSGRARFHWL